MLPLLAFYTLAFLISLQICTALGCRDRNGEADTVLSFESEVQACVVLGMLHSSKTLPKDGSNKLTPIVIYYLFLLFAQRTCGSGVLLIVLCEVLKATSSCLGSMKRFSSI